MTCLGCNGSGFDTSTHARWTRDHERVLHEAQAAMGRALKQARAAMA